RPDRRETSRRAPFEAGAPEPLEHAVHVLQHATHQGEGAHSPETERSERHAWRASLQATSSLLLSTLARSLVGLRFRAALARLLTGSLRSFDVPLSHDCLRQTAPATCGGPARPAKANNTGNEMPLPAMRNCEWSRGRTRCNAADDQGAPDRSKALLQPTSAYPVDCAPRTAQRRCAAVGSFATTTGHRLHDQTPVPQLGRCPQRLE